MSKTHKIEKGTMNPSYAGDDETHSINRVIQLNNEAVSHVLTDNDEQAISCFLKALGMLRKLIIEEQGGEDDVSPSQTILHSSTHSLSHFQENSFFLFNCIICFKKQRWCDEAPPRTADYHIYRATTSLNIAILYHRQALLGQQDCIFKAEKFYTMVMKIAGKCDTNQGTELVVKLAALNNLSEIRLEKGDFVSSEKGFQTLAWLVSSTKVKRSSLLNIYVVEGMLLNALMVHQQTLLVAPAA
jgi:hypothetical protein